MGDQLDKYEEQLVKGWEDMYKKGQLTLWILLALHDGPKHMNDIKLFIAAQTNDTLGADDKSMYRALRRYHAAEMIGFTTTPSQNGPDRKIYELTQVGQHVLVAFCKRNITDVFYKSSVQNLIKKLGEL
ncbi:MAG: PadR family transcriptional regulator [Candidatus Saccharibacteria bacterium]